MAVSLMKYLLRSTGNTCGKRRVIKLSNVRQASPAFSFPPEKLIPPPLGVSSKTDISRGQELSLCVLTIVVKFYQSRFK